MATRAVLTPPGVASFLNLKTPRAFTDGAKPRYGMNIIFDPAAQRTKEYAELEKAIQECIKARWPVKVPPNLRSPFRDGGEKEGQYEGYKKGDVFINPWTEMKPGVVNRDRQDMVDLDEVYAGWLCRANVRPFVYENGANRGVSLLLDSVQFLRPGKRLDGRKAASESFPDDEYTQDDEMV
jgi:hypothetical protein